MEKKQCTAGKLETQSDPEIGFTKLIFPFCQQRQLLNDQQNGKASPTQFKVKADCPEINGYFPMLHFPFPPETGFIPVLNENLGFEVTIESSKAREAQFRCDGQLHFQSAQEHLEAEHQSLQRGLCMWPLPFPPPFMKVNETDQTETSLTISDGHENGVPENVPPIPFAFPQFSVQPFTNSISGTPPFPFASTFQPSTLPFAGPMQAAFKSDQTSKQEERKKRKTCKMTLGNCDSTTLCYSCILCDQVCGDITELTLHVDDHIATSSPFTCPLCGKDFKFPQTCRNHIFTHMSIRPFQCSECAATYTTSGELVRHKRYKHDGGKPFKCDKCNYECVELAKLNRHTRMHEGFKPFKCPSCSYCSYDKSKIRRHYVTHTREKPFECQLCSAKFTQSGSLKTHLANVHHFKRVEFRCSYCHLFSSGNMGELRNHMKVTHNASFFPVAINEDVSLNYQSQFSQRQSTAECKQ